MTEPEDLDNTRKGSPDILKMERFLYGEMIPIEPALVGFLDQLPKKFPTVLTTGSLPIFKYHPQFYIEAVELDFQEAVNFDIADGKSSGDPEGDFIGKLLRRGIENYQRSAERKFSEIPDEHIEFFLKMRENERSTLLEGDKHIGRLDTIK